MLKEKKINIQDTNMALFGTPLEREIKKHAAEGEPAWKNMKKEVGTQIWRVEKFKIVAWPKEKYGQFYNGDSYIILYTYKKEDKILYNIHFWLGEHTSLDEAGTAAYKTVELDTYLDDLPVQYREVQGQESDKFLQLFLTNYQVLQGGIESGFKHVEKEQFQPRLLHIKGKMGKTVARPVLHNTSSLNMGDVFILDIGEKLYVFQPAGLVPVKRPPPLKLFPTSRDHAVNASNTSSAMTMMMTTPSSGGISSVARNRLSPPLKEVMMHQLLPANSRNVFCESLTPAVLSKLKKLNSNSLHSKLTTFSLSMQLTISSSGLARVPLLKRRDLEFKLPNPI
jgi:hypothetical protein